MRWRVFDAQPPNPPAPSRYEYYRGVANTTNAPNFILISPGLDRIYRPASANPATVGNGVNFKFDPNTDDVTNLSR